VQFVINYEEGGENCILHGDVVAEAFLSEVIGAEPLAGMRHMNIESIYEYGSRAGFWLHRMFSERGIPVTIYGVAMALERNKAVAAMLEADWEIASHGYRWIDYKYFGEETEREHLQKAIAIHTSYRQSSPRLVHRPTRLVVEEAGFSTTLTATPMTCLGYTTASLTW